MIIVDVESSGVDPKLCSLLSVGAVDFDNPSSQFYAECRMFEGAHIEQKAFEVNGFTEASACDEKKQSDREVLVAFLEWMRTCREWTLCGQNPSFDRDFLMHTAHRYHIDWPLAQRTVDLHSIAYAYMVREGRSIPLKNNHSALNLEAILEYVGVPTKRKNHNALEDARLEAEAFSRFLYGRSLFSEYADLPIPSDLSG